MPVIGNDIVDLITAAKESNWQRRGFLDKVFTNSEQDLIDAAVNPFETVWRLWSMKEAAYKAYVQQTGERFYNPKKLLTSIESDNQGEVNIAGISFIAQTEVSKAYVHTVCTQKEQKVSSYTPPQLATHFSRVLRVKKSTQSLETKQACLEAIASYYSLHVDHLQFIKDHNKVPKVHVKEKDYPLAVSISHHGSFGAFAIFVNDKKTRDLSFSNETTSYLATLTGKRKVPQNILTRL